MELKWRGLSVGRLRSRRSNRTFMELKLNFMVHGMYGRVECRDTLLMNEPTVVYVINEVKYPFNTPYYSVRKILEESRK